MQKETTMTRVTSTAIAALVAGTLGLAALTPAAIAQQGPNPGQHPGGHHIQMQIPGHFGGHRFERFRNTRVPGVRAGSLLDLVCSPNGAERTEIGFVRLSYRLGLTEAQRPLFDDLRAAALTAQTQYADACAARTGADATPTPVDRLANQIADNTLRLELMETLLPKLEAFYDSLDDTQKAALEPRSRDGKNRTRTRAPRPQQNGAPAAPEAPATPDAAAPATNG